MVRTWGSSESATRRNLLKGVGAATAAALVGDTVATSGSAETDDATALGDFESDLDSWRGAGETTLDRVAKSERPTAVTSGVHALSATTDRTGGRIENEARVRDADFVANPFLFATVTPGRSQESDSAVAVRFRLHYAEDGLLEDEASVVESGEKTARPHVPNALSWDLSDVRESVRANATKLEIGWAPASGRPSDSQAGDDDAWTTVVDDVHLSDDGDRIRRVRLADHFDRLQFALGAYRSTEAHLRTDHLESGAFVFAGESSVPYTVETLTDDGVRFVLDGVEYLFGGDLL